jgi:hypothetical protein
MRMDPRARVQRDEADCIGHERRKCGMKQLSIDRDRKHGALGLNLAPINRPAGNERPDRTGRPERAIRRLAVWQHEAEFGSAPPEWRSKVIDDWRRLLGHGSASLECDGIATDRRPKRGARSGDLPLAGGATHLQHKLAHLTPAIDLGMGELSAVGVGGNFAPESDAAVLDPVEPVARGAKAKILECVKREWRKRIIVDCCATPRPRGAKMKLSRLA